MRIYMEEPKSEGKPSLGEGGSLKKGKYINSKPKKAQWELAGRIKNLKRQPRRHKARGWQSAMQVCISQLMYPGKNEGKHGSNRTR